MKLAEYDAEITRLEGIRNKWKARRKLRELSCEMRRMLWQDRARAMSIARRADDAASKIESENDDMIPTSPMPRFDGLFSGGIWHPAVQ